MKHTHKSMFSSGHPRGPSRDFHHGDKGSAKDSGLELGPGKARGMNPDKTKHHTSPAAEYPHGHAGAKKK